VHRRNAMHDASIRLLQQRLPVEDSKKLFWIFIGAEWPEARARSSRENQRRAFHEAAPAAASASSRFAATASPGFRPTTIKLKPEAGRSPSKILKRGTSRSKKRDCASGNPCRLKTREFNHHAKRAI